MKVICPVALIKKGECSCGHHTDHDIGSSEYADCGLLCTGSGTIEPRGVACMPIKEAKGWALRYLIEKGGTRDDR